MTVTGITGFNDIYDFYDSFMTNALKAANTSPQFYNILSKCHKSHK